MKSLVSTSQVLAAAFLFLGGTQAEAATTAECQDPPGGRITCEDDQAAFCKVIQGKVDGYCKKPPANLSQTELSAWTLSEVTGEKVETWEVDRFRNQRILKGASWEEGRTSVTFTLPKASKKEGRQMF